MITLAVCGGKAAKLPLTGGHISGVSGGHGHVTMTSTTNAPVGIISQDSEVKPDGSFHNVWEAENGIKVQEEGSAVQMLEKGALSHTVTGQISWIDLEGNPISLRYSADENGYRPEGDFIPTIPPVIARSLEWIKEHPYVEKEHTASASSSSSTSHHHHLDLPVVESN